MLIIIPVIVAIPVYVVLLIGTKTISENEILQMPGGSRIVKILKKVRLLR